MPGYVDELRRSFFRRTLFFVIFFSGLFLITLPFIVYFVELDNYQKNMVNDMQQIVDGEIKPILDKSGSFRGKENIIEENIEDFIRYYGMYDFRIWKGNTIVFDHINKKMENESFVYDKELSEVYRTKKPVKEITKPSKQENTFLTGKGYLLEIYVPVINEGKVTSVVEAYLPLPGFQFLGIQTIIVMLIALTIPFIIYIILYTQFKKALNILSTYQKSLKDTYNYLWKSYFNSIKSLSKVLEMKDVETEGHCERVVVIAIYIAEKMGLGRHEIGQLVIGAYLHDIGKVSIPDEILFKKEKLSKAQRMVIEKHVYKGYELLADDDVLSAVNDLVLYHHEKWDGTGYPKGLKGEEIPMVARIFSVADVFDALISKRPYKRAYTFDEAMDVVKNYFGTFFDPAVVEIFTQLSEEEYRVILDSLESTGVTHLVNDAVESILTRRVSKVTA
ncbi:metal dependent phosphohydrolase [Flexistipes sinusarabici DSM 4947]|uniref:Metal dependent phosphohydrolase n=1 Tax=Flexistipes sinusarabici (strain ATCC 49648 / DSM 4947 / MAS 10) TaxID=717231 RepID=F8E4R1_FLESM|nr:HD-GYP domain-containing protein [Flexistipes sinusarabici]AEI15619.1 metal dependent phosphohydrolase [Flexistipes sinusarabici DSM 4947]